MVGKLIKIFIFCGLALGVVICMGKFPVVAVSMTALGIIFLFFIFHNSP